MLQITTTTPVVAIKGSRVHARCDAIVVDANSEP